MAPLRKSKLEAKSGEDIHKKNKKAIGLGEMEGGFIRN